MAGLSRSSTPESDEPNLDMARKRRRVDVRDKPGHDRCVFSYLLYGFAKTTRDDACFQLAAAGNLIRTRRFCLPFFSIPVTSMQPISLSRATCVPPQG